MGVTLSDVLPLRERLSAYRRIVKLEPNLSTAEREYLFSLALCPEKPQARALTWEHLMVCRERGCLLCAEGTLATDLAA